MDVESNRQAVAPRGWAWWRARLLFLPTLIWNWLLGRVLKVRRWWSRIEPQLWLGALPLPGDARRLAQLGVTDVVNTCEEFRGPLEQYHQCGIRQFRMPTIDFMHPTLADVERAVEFIEQAIQNGGTVYVHCKAGRGRSATVVACWLIKYRGLSRQQAQQRIAECRPHINRHIDQRPVVIEFERRHGSPPADG